MIGNVGLIAGGVFALSSAIMSFFTDWDDIGSQSDEEE